MVRFLLFLRVFGGAGPGPLGRLHHLAAARGAGLNFHLSPTAIQRLRVGAAAGSAGSLEGMG